jgi:predicted PurR-regulated permease PerM
MNLDVKNIIIYCVLSVVVLYLTWRLIKKAFKVVIFLLAVVAMIGFFTGALNGSKTPKEFLDKSIDNSKGVISNQLDKAKEAGKKELDKKSKEILDKAKDDAVKAAKDAISTSSTH